MMKKVAASLIALCAAGVLAVPTLVQADNMPALSGQISSHEEGAMEGVVVSARKDGSPITISVISNAKGEYHFPQGRLEPGSYSLNIRAVGYDLAAPAKVSIDAKKPARADLGLKKTADLKKQLSNAELLMSIPGTEKQKEELIGCGECHTLQRPLFSKYNAADMTATIQRMGAHTTNASPNHPFFNQDASDTMSRAPTKAQAELGAWIASINLSSRDDFNFPLKTLPRPKGKATQVIYTTYDLPRADAAPHDPGRDAQGYIWYSDFQSPILGRLDPRTGQVKEWPIPTQKSTDAGFPTGGLQIAFDGDGNVYEGTMGQAQVVRFNPRTEKMDIWPSPDWNKGDARVTMIDPRFATIDGTIWINEAGLAPGNTAFKFNLKTGEWSRVLVPQGSPPAYAYGIVANSGNDLYGMGQRNDNLWLTDAKTLETRYFQLPEAGGGGRRGHIDSQDRLWFAQFYGNAMTMFDPRTQKFTVYKVPTKFSNPYDVQFDDKTYLWGGGMGSDLVNRVNTMTGEFTEYLLPQETNIRHVDVQKDGALSSLWVEDQHNGKILHIEPLTP